MKYFIKALQMMAFVSEWSTVALKDGVVTMDELYTLGEGLCIILGVDFKVQIEKE